MPSKAQLKRAKGKISRETKKVKDQSYQIITTSLECNQQELMQIDQIKSIPETCNIADNNFENQAQLAMIIDEIETVADENMENGTQFQHGDNEIPYDMDTIISILHNSQGYLLSDHMRYLADKMRSISNYDMRSPELIWYLDSMIPVEQNQTHLQIMYIRSVIPGAIGHWITAYYDRQIVRVYDSMNGQTLSADAEVFLQKLFPFNPTIELRSVQAQQNSYDCGLFAIAFCVSILFDKDPEQELYDLNQLRIHAAGIFSTGIITPFPTLVAIECSSELATTSEARRKEYQHEYYHKRKSIESESMHQERLEKVRKYKQNKLANENDMERNNRLQVLTNNKQNRLANENEEERNIRLQALRDSQQSRLASVSFDERNLRMDESRNAIPIQSTYKAAYRGLEETVDAQYLGKMDKICEFCSAKHFLYEQPADGKFTLCCRKGKHAQDKLEEYPMYLRSLVTGITRDSNNFRAHVRSYNSAMAFASMGANLKSPPGQGPFTYRIHGQIYHNAKSLHPNPGDYETYAQLYIVDTKDALAKRMNVAANQQCLPDIMKQLDILLRRINPFCAAYMMLKEVEQREIQKAQLNNTTLPTIEMWFLNEHNKDRRRYNIPTCNEVAVIFTGNNGAPPPNRDICVHPKDQGSIRINQMSGNCDPMTYPLIFPHGEIGWTVYRKAKDNAKKVSALQFYVNRLQTRLNVFNPCLELGKLTQQYIVDAYCKVESERLSYIEHNQGKLRVELYAGLCDHINNLATKEGARPGTMVILPSTFQGGARFMQTMYQNAMAIVREFGKPDLFITVTCNPKWREITEELRNHQTASDRPDIVARVFSGKIKSLLDELFKDKIFGEVISHIYVIEFQKRGLPHMHLLMMLSPQDKIRNRAEIDSIISAEIPDANAEPELYQIVRSSMVHGPCGQLNPNSPCMQNNTCSKKYPKEFRDETCENVNGYPIYRRRNTGATIDILKRDGTLKYTVDNRWIVPYNPYLSKKYSAHINVEVCSSVKSVKYICDYLCKGHDCASVKLGETTDDKKIKWNEISAYLDARYVSAPESCWRLWEFPLHGNSHAICQLAVHLKDQQSVVFNEGKEIEALEKAARLNTTLTAWFELNRTDVSARQYRYTDIPTWYVFTAQKKWKIRQKTTKPLIGRMIAVSPKDEERYFLRMNLANVSGATSFEDLLTVNGVVCGSYHAAAIERGLLTTNEECSKCMEDAVIDKFPQQLRQLFAFIICCCEAADAKTLWETFKQDLIEDFSPNMPPQVAESKALRIIEEITILHGYRLDNFGLPKPLDDADALLDTETVDIAAEHKQGEENIAKFNVRQMELMELIMTAVHDENCTQRQFFVDGPGGTGKTFLFNTIISVVRGLGHVAIATAWTGIAGTLLKGGRTVHSTFKLGVPVTETTVAKVKETSELGKCLRKAKIILWDEATIAPNHALKAVDVFLRDLMRDKSKPFGGKIVVLGGDFRQCLPIVNYTNHRTAIMETSMLCSPLWHLFKKIRLEENMRVYQNEIEFCEFLLSVGNGDFDPVTIPAHCIVNGSLVDAIYGIADINVRDGDAYKLIDKAILCPKNDQTLATNEVVLAKFPGTMRTYYSRDSIVTEDDNEIMNYPVEFLNKQTPCGLPPHVLNLKEGAIVMLLRNMNPKRGLCNGTRLMVKQMKDNVLDLEILTGQFRGERMYLPRIDLAPVDSDLPFILKRRQFPIRLSFSMTINKAQGQTFETIGIDLRTPVFAHGQLYVAMSRVKSFQGLKVKLALDAIDQKTGEGIAANKVFKEILT